MLFEMFLQFFHSKEKLRKLAPLAIYFSDKQKKKNKKLICISQKKKLTASKICFIAPSPLIYVSGFRALYDTWKTP